MPFTFHLWELTYSKASRLFNVLNVCFVDQEIMSITIDKDAYLRRIRKIYSTWKVSNYSYNTIYALKTAFLEDIITLILLGIKVIGLKRSKSGTQQTRIKIHLVLVWTREGRIPNFVWRHVTFLQLWIDQNNSWLFFKLGY